jgi:lipoprotein-anchoring transpeptidase ErfK/SrfK
MRLACVLLLVCLFGFATDRAQADILIAVNKGSQRMTVTVDGAPRYHFVVSTGAAGGPPSGNFRPERLERKWYSRKFDWSPMPHAIFFYKGFAIHGTFYTKRLGTRASHGCVRLSPADAATLFALVEHRGAARTRIVISDTGALARR